MTLPKRHGSTDSYRYGFQGQEKDDEVKGEGNSLNYKYRMHDPRIGRFFAVDPKSGSYPWYSPYQFGGNTPIMSIELEGLEPIVENGILIGYTIQPKQGPTQISDDLNDPATQRKYGYTLIDKIDWGTVVWQNMEHYKSVGDWGNSNMFDKDNPVYETLQNSGQDLVIAANQEVTVTTTNKHLFTSGDSPDITEGNIITLNFFSSWGAGGGGDILGHVERKSGYNYKTTGLEMTDIFPGGGPALKGLAMLFRRMMWHNIKNGKDTDSPTNNLKAETEKIDKITIPIVKEDSKIIIRTYPSGARSYSPEEHDTIINRKDRKKVEELSERRNDKKVDSMLNND